jgi:hypothetical protein
VWYSVDTLVKFGARGGPFWFARSITCPYLAYVVLKDGILDRVFGLGWLTSRIRTSYFRFFSNQI